MLEPARQFTGSSSPSPAQARTRPSFNGGGLRAYLDPHLNAAAPTLARSKEPEGVAITLDGESLTPVIEWRIRSTASEVGASWMSSQDATQDRVGLIDLMP